MKPSEECKLAGLDSLNELAALSGKSKNTLINWHKKSKALFDVALMRASEKKMESHADSVFAMAFNKNTDIAEIGGAWEVRCKKGLFCAFAPTLAQALKEAMHYFMRHYADGEYDE